MSVRLARNAFNSAVRRAQTNASSSAARVSRRTMASSTSHGAAKSSDTPWIVGSLLVFGPAFLYLVSPSTRKNTHHVHDDKHDFPALLNDEHAKFRATEKADAEGTPKPEAEVVEDDEGTKADVSSSVALSQSEDVPKDAQPAEIHEDLKSAAESDSSKAPADEGSADPTAEAEKQRAEKAATDEKKGTFKEGADQGPTDMGTARDAATDGVTPKEVAEKKSQN